MSADWIYTPYLLPPSPSFLLPPPSYRCGLDPLPPNPSLPSFLHYCSRHDITLPLPTTTVNPPTTTGKPRGPTWVFYKRMVPHDVIPSCGPMMLEIPPPDLFSP